MTLETAAEISAIAGIPVAVVGWFIATNPKNIITSTATAGDVHGESGSIAIGYDSPITFNINSASIERRIRRRNR